MTLKKQLKPTKEFDLAVTCDEGFKCPYCKKKLFQGRKLKNGRVLCQECYNQRKYYINRLV